MVFELCSSIVSSWGIFSSKGCRRQSYNVWMPERIRWIQLWNMTNFLEFSPQNWSKTKFWALRNAYAGFVNSKLHRSWDFRKHLFLSRVQWLVFKRKISNLNVFLFLDYFFKYWATHYNLKIEIILSFLAIQLDCPLQKLDLFTQIDVKFNEFYSNRESISRKNKNSLEIEFEFE